MLRTHLIFDRYWSLAAAIILPIVVESIVSFEKYEEMSWAVLSAVCMALLVHSWFMNRRYTQSKWRLAFWTLFLSLVAFGPIWLGLNVIRFYSYDSQWISTLWYHNLYGCVVELQDAIILLAEVLGIAVALWVIVDLVRWLAKRVMRKHWLS
jgi:hypothetical protein